MSQGLLGKASVSSAYTAVYTVSPNKSATVNVRIVNQSTVNGVTLRLAICPAGYVAGSTPAVADYIEPLDVPLAAGSVLEETALAMSSGEVLVAFASGPVTVRAMGFEG